MNSCVSRDINRRSESLVFVKKKLISVFYLSVLFIDDYVITWSKYCRSAKKLTSVLSLLFFAMRLIRETIHFGHQLPCIPNLVHLSVSLSVGLVGYNLEDFKLPRTFCLFLLPF